MTNLKILDGLRGLAAVYVMIGHCKWLLWEGMYAHHQHANDFINTFLAYFFTCFRYGHEAVIFFFVLSGFVIHLKYSKRLAINPDVKFDTVNYFVRRTKRIYPVLVISLLLTMLFDNYGRSLGFDIYNHGTSSLMVNLNIGNDWSMSTLIGNFFLLMNTYVPTFGSNGALWSLKFEWWFYVIYPFLFALNRKHVSLTLLLVAALFIIRYFSLLPMALVNDVATSLFCWYVGCFFADVYTNRTRVSILHLTPFIFLIPVALVIDFGYFKDSILSIGFVGLISFLFMLQVAGIQFKILCSLKWLGDMSYTLYAIHLPIVVFISGWAYDCNGDSFPQGFEYIFPTIICVMALSYLLHFIIEKPFTKRSYRVAHV